MIFDRNSITNGSSITHPTNSSNVTISTPGIYEITFNGSVSPAGDTIFPLAMLLVLLVNSNQVGGAAAQCSLTSANDVENMAFTQIVNITQVPATISVRANGGNFFFSNATINIKKLGTVS